MRLEPLWSFEPEVLELLPAFLSRGQERLGEMREASETRDFTQLARLAYGLRGSAALYDLSAFRWIGEQLELTAQAQDPARAGQLLVQLGDLLDKLAEELSRQHT